MTVRQNQYKPKLLQKLEETPYRKLSPIERCVITEPDWRLQNKALQQLARMRKKIEQQNHEISCFLGDGEDCEDVG